MTDVYVYRFTGSDGAQELIASSPRRASLKTIKEFGDPIMESQIVVDDAELDTNGFFYGDVANDADPAEALRSEIKSLNLRAAARDSEALTLEEVENGAHKYMLELESRELRRQAKVLQKQCVAEADGSHNAEFLQVGNMPSAG